MKSNGGTEEITMYANALKTLSHKGDRLVYAKGSLRVMCGEGRGLVELSSEERAWREVRKAAWLAYKEGRVNLLQRLVSTHPHNGTQVFEYLAEGRRG